MAEQPAQIFGRTPVDRPTQQLGQFVRHPRQPEQFSFLPALKLDQHVDIGVGPECLAERRTKEGPCTHMMSPVERRMCA